MLEQILHCRDLAIGAVPFAESGGDALVEPHATFVDEPQNDGRRGNDLRQRCEIEWRVVGDLKPFAPHRSGAAADINRRSRKNARLDCPADDVARLVHGQRVSGPATALTAMPTPMQRIVPTTTYQVHASGVNAFTAIIRASDVPMPAMTPRSVA